MIKLMKILILILIVTILEIMVIITTAYLRSIISSYFHLHSADNPTVLYWNDVEAMLVDTPVDDVMRHPRIVPQIDLVPTICMLLG